MSVPYIDSLNIKLKYTYYTYYINWFIKPNYVIKNKSYDS